MKKFWIAICAVILVAALLAALIFIPRKEIMAYNMYGYIVSPTGEVLQAFTFQVGGTKYDFVIDLPGGKISFQEGKLEKVRSDGIVLNFVWGIATINAKYSYGYATADYILQDKNIIGGTLVHYDPQIDAERNAPLIMNLDEGWLWMNADSFVPGAYILGTTDADVDVATLLARTLNFMN